MPLSERLLDPATKHDFIALCVREQWRRFERTQFYLCLALRRLYRDNVHRGSGFSKFSDYVEATYGIPVKLAWVFSQIGEHLERLPLTRAAMERGDVGYTKVREFAAFVDTRTEAEWIEFARHHSNRELERRVRKHQADLKGTPHEEEKKVVSNLKPKDAQAVRAAQERLMKEMSRPVRQEEMLGLLSTNFLDGGNGAASDEKTSKKPRPYLSLHLCPSCTSTWIPAPGENLPIPIDQWIAEFQNGTPVVNLMGHDLCDCRGVKHRADLCPDRAAPLGPAAKNRHVPEDVRRTVEARDGFRCRVPGCTSSGPLEISHLQPYRDGAPMDPRVLAQHCSVHNRLIESGKLTITGYAPCEAYHLADGTFLGFGYDPVVRSVSVPHVGHSAEAACAVGGGAPGT